MSMNLTIGMTGTGRSSIADRSFGVNMVKPSLDWYCSFPRLSGALLGTLLKSLTLDKAWEFQIYFYGLCPTLLMHLLPRKYWQNFCKLVAGIRILQRPRISKQDLLCGHDLLMAFAREFEDLYYQHKETRIHFVRQSVHLLTHIASETVRVGPLACYAQWTLETAIGNLGREIRQDRDMSSLVLGTTTQSHVKFH